MKDFFDTILLDYTNQDMSKLKEDAYGVKAFKYFLFILANFAIQIFVKIIGLVLLLILSIGIGIIAMLSTIFEASANFGDTLKYYSKFLFILFKRTWQKKN